MPAVVDADLYNKLEYLYETYDRGYLQTDPLAFLHMYDNRRDQEVVGLIASSLAYGRVEQFSITIKSILEVMGKSPYDFIAGFEPSQHARLFEHIKYRFHTGRDIACWFIS